VYAHLDGSLRAIRHVLSYTGEGTGNNYAYLVSDDKTKEAVIIDPANPEEYVLYVAMKMELG